MKALWLLVMAATIVAGSARADAKMTRAALGQRLFPGPGRASRRQASRDLAEQGRDPEDAGNRGCQRCREGGEKPRSSGPPATRVRPWPEEVSRNRPS